MPTKSYLMLKTNNIFVFNDCERTDLFNGDIITLDNNIIIEVNCQLIYDKCEMCKLCTRKCVIMFDNKTKFGYKAEKNLGIGVWPKFFSTNMKMLQHLYLSESIKNITNEYNRDKKLNEILK